MPRLRSPYTDRETAVGVFVQTRGSVIKTERQSLAQALTIHAPEYAIGRKVVEDERFLGKCY